MRTHFAMCVSFVLMAAALLGCGGGGGSSNTPPQINTPQVASARFAFVANRDANTISVFNVNQTTGLLSGSATVATGACVGPRYLELSAQHTMFVSCAES